MFKAYATGYLRHAVGAIYNTYRIGAATFIAPPPDNAGFSAQVISGKITSLPDAASDHIG